MSDTQKRTLKEMCRTTRAEIDQMLDELAHQAGAGEAGEPVFEHTPFFEQADIIRQKVDELMHECNAYGRDMGLITSSGLIL